MKKKVIILGSTGSIGQNTIDIFKKDKDNFKLTLLSTNKNVPKIMRQAIEFNVKHIIITDKIKFSEAKKKYNKLKGK